MRFSYVVLVAATALFASCEQVLAADSSNRNNLVKTTPAEGKRFLRSLSTKTNADDDEEEERAGGLGMIDDAVKKIDDATDKNKNLAYMINMFKGWEGKTRKQVKASIEGQPSKAEFKAMWEMYKAYKGLGKEELLKRLS